MDALILDTNIVSYVMKGHSAAEHYRPILQGRTLAISFMTVAELFEGAFRARWSEKKFDQLKSEIKKYVVVPYSPAVCEAWGRIRAERRAKPISVDDAWIAATAVVHASTLVTHNPDDFRGITGLKVLTEHRP